MTDHCKYCHEPLLTSEREQGYCADCASVFEVEAYEARREFREQELPNLLREQAE